MRRVTVLVLFVLIALTWGTTWLAMRIAVETIPPIFATGMGFMFAAPLLISIAYLRKTLILFPPGQRLCQLWTCLHFICKYAASCFDSISVFFEYKNEYCASNWHNYGDSGADWHPLRGSEYKYKCRGGTGRE
ncbi:DMT family transporter [Pseudomonas sp. SWRI124]|nr:DMT family transporter [Pseudomonas khavaziana]MBV4482630.1 DMT family transporter [Pseudomonas khavaziana]